MSRSRYWGIPIPIWSLKKAMSAFVLALQKTYKACEKSVVAGMMVQNPIAILSRVMSKDYDKIDLHKNYVDKIVLVSDSGKPMHRESDL